MQHVPLVEYYSLPSNGDPLNKLIRLDIIGVADKALGFLESQGANGQREEQSFSAAKGSLEKSARACWAWPPWSVVQVRQCLASLGISRAPDRVAPM
jgi:hypothetical protein